MKRVLLYTDDRDQAEIELRSHHGRVTHRLSENLILARLPDGLSVGALHLAREVDASTVGQLSAIEHGFVRAFQDMEARQASGVYPSGDKLPWDVPGRQAPRLAPAPSQNAATSAGTSSYLVGRVAVGLVVVSGPGKLTFSQSETDKVQSQVLEGLDFLVSSEPTASLSFDVELQAVTITTPEQSSCTDNCDQSYDACEAIWRNPAMAALGYSPDRSGMVAYVRDLQAQPNVNWAYVAYFTKYTLCHFAYAYFGGPQLVMQYSNDGWGTGNIHRVFAHETGHIFYAQDEYKSSDCVCGSPSGYFNAPNNNCQNCPGSHINCLMGNNDLQLCFWSRRQLGWGGFGPQTNVSDQNDAKTSAGPALAEWNGIDYMAYRGEASSTLYLCTFDGTTWGKQSNITDKNGAKSSTAPSLAVFRGRLYMAYRGESSDNIYISSYDGSNWSTQTKVTDKNDAKTSATPVLCTYNDKLYMFYRGASSSNFYMCSYDGNSWSKQVNITDKNDAKVGAAPALAIYQGKLWVAYVGEGGSRLYAFSYDGAFSSQTEITSINDAKSTGGPALGVMNGLLYMLYRGTGSTNLWACAFNGSTWLEQWKVTDQNTAETSAQPALAPLPSLGVLVAAYRGKASSHIWSCQVFADAPVPSRSMTAMKAQDSSRAIPARGVESPVKHVGCGCGAGAAGVSAP